MDSLAWTLKSNDISTS
ncbi:unnamed protein product [Amaranthus hypochondriacus]